MYEGYGPNGVAIMIECLSDNRNRAASEFEVAVTRNGGSMADPGFGVISISIAKASVIVNKASGALTEDSILEAVT
jgi:transcriptional/translational regulatory protein YebC/TACO1